MQNGLTAKLHDRSIDARIAAILGRHRRGRRAGRPSHARPQAGYLRAHRLHPGRIVILGIVAVGMYFLSYPDKFDAVLNWMLGRHPSGPAF